MYKHIGIIFMIVVAYTLTPDQHTPMTIRDLSSVIISVGIGICLTIIKVGGNNDN